MYWFIVFFVVAEAVIMTLKYKIYRVDQKGTFTEGGTTPTQIAFLVLHVLRAAFPVTLMVQLILSIRLYLSLFSEHLSRAAMRRTIAFTACVLTIMAVSTLWYNFIVQYYYIVHLQGKQPSQFTSDKYFPAVYYTTTVINELCFCLLLAMAIVVRIFARARFRRIQALTERAASSRSHTLPVTGGMTRSNSEASAWPTSDGTTVGMAESRGEKPLAR